MNTSYIKSMWMIWNQFTWIWLYNNAIKNIVCMHWMIIMCLAVTFVFLFVCCFCCLGHTWQCSGNTPDSAFRNYSCKCSVDHMGYQGKVMSAMSKANILSCVLLFLSTSRKFLNVCLLYLLSFLQKLREVDSILLKIILKFSTL